LLDQNESDARNDARTAERQNEDQAELNKRRGRRQATYDSSCDLPKGKPIPEVDSVTETRENPEAFA
jgi:hypothetical protein